MGGHEEGGIGHFVPDCHSPSVVTVPVRMLVMMMMVSLVPIIVLVLFLVVMKMNGHLHVAQKEQGEAVGGAARAIQPMAGTSAAPYHIVCTRHFT